MGYQFCKTKAVERLSVLQDTNGLEGCMFHSKFLTWDFITKFYSHHTEATQKKFQTFAITSHCKAHTGTLRG
jgi:hypothetical protein